MHTRMTALLPMMLAAGCATNPDKDPVQLRLNDLEARVARMERIVANDVQVSQNVDEMQGNLRELRGDIEQLQHTNETLSKQQRDLYGDLDRRLSAVATGAFVANVARDELEELAGERHYVTLIEPTSAKLAVNILGEDRDRLRVAGAGNGFDLVTLQDEAHVGFESMIASIMMMARGHLAKLDARRREPCPVSELVVGVQCGGSDAFSGVTANPAVGFATDLLVCAGATVMFSEVTEVRDGIGQLTARAASVEVAQVLIREMDWYDRYLESGFTDRSANTTPGNKSGGISNIVEKAMGSIVKSGTSQISGVVPPGERAQQKGLLFAATPASDLRWVNSLRTSRVRRSSNAYSPLSVSRSK